MTGFSEAERAYLSTQRLGRPATVEPNSRPQANPVGFFPQDDGTVLVGGYALGTTKKQRSLQANPKVALAVDDIVSLRPWAVRGIDVRGEAELLKGPHDLGAQCGSTAAASTRRPRGSGAVRRTNARAATAPPRASRPDPHRGRRAHAS